MLKVIEFAFTGYPVTDLARARAFYEGTLNLKVTKTFGEGDKMWVEYDVGPHTLAINNTTEGQWKPSEDGAAVALEVEDFDAAVAWLREKKADIYMGPIDSPVCHMVLVRDPDGNSICIHKRKPGNH